MNEFQFLHSSFEQLDNRPKSLNQKLPAIYLVDNDPVINNQIKKYLEKKFILNVFSYLSPIECMLELEKKIKTETVVNQIPFCLIVDISFVVEGVDGLMLIDRLKERGHHFVSIAMTSFASIETAIHATKKGVFHYLAKPFEFNLLGDLITLSITKKLNMKENSILHNEAMVNRNNFSLNSNQLTNSKFKIESPKVDDVFCGMVGRSKQMKQVFERIKKVASSDSTILISGPSGTGKELVANALHLLSPRKSHNMVSVNCGAIPSELLESELFGHEKGAFTGAVTARKGRFEMAHRGTIFLDEIGDMPFLLQVKILRVLQNRVIERLGSVESSEIDVRIITATHRNLEEEVLNGNFREDLYYRLNVIPIKIPPLKERRDDIPLMISYFLSKFVNLDLKNNIEFDDETLELLYSYEWPGNVRELENLIERLVILKGGSVVKVSDLPANLLKKTPIYNETFKQIINLPETGVDLKLLLSEIEDSLINQALEVTGGNKNQASKLLSMNRTTLIEKMKKKGVVLNSLREDHL